jgi:protein CpxP
MPQFRLIAVASIVGSALILAPLGTASAQNNPAGKPPAAQAATSSTPETVDQRIATLKTALKITPDQESKWSAVASAMRDNAAAMDKLIKDKRAKMAKLNAIDDLKTYQEITQAHLDGLKSLTSAFKSLYDSMPAEQKANADHVFDSYGPAKAGTQG